MVVRRTESVKVSVIYPSQAARVGSDNPELTTDPRGRSPADALRTYQRSTGMIGSLSHLIRGTAIDAINDGTEKITRSHPDGIRLDHAAQNSYRPKPVTRPRTAGAGV
jgi:hypothetical protein